MLKTEHYLEDDVFEDECRNIFYTSWIAVGFSNQLVNQNDYFLTHIGNKEIIVQKFKDRISAFTNVCSHRHSAIHLSETGCRPLQCPYHGWAYNDQGVPKGIPLGKSCFGAVDQEKHRLQPWRVEVCGHLIFLAGLGCKVTLAEWLGGDFERVRRYTEGMEKKILHYRKDIASNWKFLIQNSQEIYHIVDVHPKTFGKGGSYRDVESAMFFDESLDGVHQRYSVYYDNPIKSSRNVIRSNLDAISQSLDFVDHRGHDSVVDFLLIFPFTALSFHKKLGVSFWRYLPVSSGLSRMDLQVFLPDLSHQPRYRRWLARLLAPHVAKFMQTVCDEDSVVCEAAQRGVANADDISNSPLGRNEHLVHRFQKTYLSKLYPDTSR